MVLNKLMDTVKDANKRAGFTRNGIKILIDKMLDEIRVMKSSPNNKALIDKKLIDLQILLLQTAKIYGTDLDAEWKAKFKKRKDKKL